MKLILPFYECGMCQLPAHAQCDECTEIAEMNAEPVMMMEPKKWIGSGEDGHLFEEHV